MKILLREIHAWYIFYLIKNVTRYVTYSLYPDMRFQSRRNMKNRSFFSGKEASWNL